MRRMLVAVTAVAAFACLAPLSAAAARTAASGPEYYLALGDSLARGAQPNASGTTVPTNKGYANDLLAVESSQFPNLTLKDLGCLGETTKTMIHGGICTYATGSQLNQAVKFLQNHKGHVAFVTIDIGANDVDLCVSPTGMIKQKCLGKGINHIKRNLPTIAAALRKAAGASVPIIGMTYYDPFLADWLEGTSGRALAGESQLLAKAVNGDITAAYGPANVRVADVAGAFLTSDPFTDLTGLNGKRVPVAVANICDLTWMCAPPPLGPNIHANPAGYSLIAETFAGKL